MVSGGRSGTTQSPAWRRVSRGSRQAFGRGGNLDRSQGCPQIDRKGDIEIYNFPCAGRSLIIIDVTCVSSYSADRRLRHAPDGEPLRSAWVAEVGKEASYSTLDHGRYDFMPLAFDVHGGVAPKADESLRRRRAAIAVRNRTSLTEGLAFSAKYSVLLNKLSGERVSQWP